MKLAISKTANPNYLAKIVQVETFTKHPNADKLKLVNIGGFVTACSIDSPVGVYIYFPVECQISQKYLHENNLYRIKTMNHDLDVNPGFFEEKGRVRCINLRGFASEGLIMPITTLKPDFNLVDDSYLIGTEFDEVDGELLVQKYVIKKTQSNLSNNPPKTKVFEETILEGQFKFHPDTEQLKKNLHKFKPNTQIHISHKFHGTSAIFTNLLVKKKLNFFEKILKFCKVKIVDTEYKTFCSSRKVIKDPELNKRLRQSFYDVDIWNIALEVVKPLILKGQTIYAEITGYLPNGKEIQKDYDYGCVYDQKLDYSKMTPLQMYEANLFKIHIYRITQTNVDGKVFEMSPYNLQQYCQSYGLTPVVQDFYGTVYDYVTHYVTAPYYEGLTEVSYEKHFLQALVDRYLERECGWCKNKVPAEGIVVRIDQPAFEAYKLKSLSFLKYETAQLDKGEENIEDDDK